MLNDIILEIINGRNIAILGGGGVGKTYLTNQIIKLLGKDLRIARAASTGIAATHIEGMTIHRFSGMGGLTCPEDFVKICYSKSWKEARYRIAEADVVIIDEISMVRSDSMNMLDFLFKTATNKRTLPFGGKQMVFVGDFLQLPPVVKYKEYFEYPWAFQSRAWREANVKCFSLFEVKRQTDKEFIYALNKVRMGFWDKSTDDLFMSRQNVELEKLNVEPLKLFGTNKKVNTYNENKLKEIDSTSHLFGAKSWYKEKSDWFNIKREVNGHDTLDLKIGCQVMITANEKDGKYVNGTMGRYLGMTKVDPNAETQMERTYPRLIIEKDDGVTIELPMKRWEFLDDETPKEIYREAEEAESWMKRRELLQEYMRGYYIQYPIRLAYATTVHKSQGMTLTQLDYDCGDMFAEAQVYVALSRVKTLEGLRISNWNPNKIKANKAAVEFFKALQGEL